jgi:hypothetical protein
VAIAHGAVGQQPCGRTSCTCMRSRCGRTIVCLRLSQGSTTGIRPAHLLVSAELEAKCRGRTEAKYLDMAAVSRSWLSGQATVDPAYVLERVDGGEPVSGAVGMGEGMWQTCM